MKPCSEQQKTLVLDVLGELDAGKRSEWETHLRACRSCSAERLRLMGLLGKVKKTMEPPILPSGGVQRSAAALRRRLSKGFAEGWWKPPGLTPMRVLPAAGALCALVLALTLSTRDTLKPGRGLQPPAGPAITRTIPDSDREIIENMYLLKEIESLQELVHVVDHPRQDPSRGNPGDNIQGMKRHEKEKIYA